MDNWNKLKRPPEWALKQIQAGRLRGKSDINPQWRYQAMTEVYGECGIGWKFSIDRLWQEQGPDNQIFAFAQVNVQTKQKDEWSEPIPGIGGHMLIVKESKGLHANDEAYKMAVTDALSTAMKMLGVAADIYSGSFDGSKYTDRTEKPSDKPQTAKKSKSRPIPKETTRDKQLQTLVQQFHLMGITGADNIREAVNSWLDTQDLPHIKSAHELTDETLNTIVEEMVRENNGNAGVYDKVENATDQMDELPEKAK